MSQFIVVTCNHIILSRYPFIGLGVRGMFAPINQIELAIAPHSFGVRYLLCYVYRRRGTLYILHLYDECDA